MQKLITMAATVFAAGLMLVGNALAQQTPPATTQQAPASGTTQAPPAKPKTAPATKPKSSAAKPAPAAKAPLTLKTQKDKVSYAIGMNMGRGLHAQSVHVDPSILLQGMKDAMAESKTLLTEDEAKDVLMALQGEIQKKQEEKTRQAGDANKKEGEDYLAANKAKDGVVTLPSGLQYKILTEGTGAKPGTNDSVTCNYKGTLINGKEFDSSYKRGQPATFPVGGVIKGWTEALQLMPVGSKWQLFVPADLAYGQRGAGADIGPNATLIFEVELLSIQAPKDKEAK